MLRRLRAPGNLKRYLSALCSIGAYRIAIEMARQRSAIRWQIIMLRFRSRGDSRIIFGDPLVAVLACCLQESIYWDFRVTNVRNELGYTHYSAEALQMLRVAAGLDPIEPAYRFRNSLIGAPIASHQELKAEFEHADVFVIEVASRLIYEDGMGHVYHHVAFDSPPSNLSLPKISVRVQTDADLESDLIAIRELVAPRPIVVVSHLVSKDSGSRANLRTSTEEICLKMKVPYIDLLKGVTEFEVNKLVVPEPVVAHLTPKGHAYVSTKYRSTISSVLRDSSKQKVVQIFPPRESESKYHGFGDFLQGSAYLLEFARQSGLDAGVSLSGCALGEYLVNTFPLSNEQLSSVARVYLERTIPIRNDLTVLFTNKRPSGEWKSPLRESVIRSCLTPRLDFQEHLDSRFSKFGIKPNMYAVIHVRFGDDAISGKNAVDSGLISKAMFEVDRMVADSDEPVVVMSDSPVLESFVSGGRAIFVHSMSGHIGQNPLDRGVAKATLEDFFLMGASREIRSLSVYPWISGFAKSASDVFNVKLTAAKL